MSYRDGLTLLDPTWDVHRWPRFEDYRISGDLLIPAGRQIGVHDATQVGTLAGELVATGYEHPRDPAALLRFVRQYGLVTAHTTSPEAVACDSLEAVSKIRRHVEITLGYLRDPKRSAFPEADALWHVNQGIREWLPVGVSKAPGRQRKYEFGYRHFGLAGVIFQQLAQAMEGAKALKVCQYPGCHKLFVAGRGGMTGRKIDAQYCSDRCRVYHWRERNPGTGPKRAGVKRTTRPVVRKGGLRHAPR